jgi:tRNA (guanine37-N1)-methyltransferase
MRIDVLTLFPGIHRRSARAWAWSAAPPSAGLISVQAGTRAITPPTTTGAWTSGPFGGGPGMVMLMEPLGACLDAALAADPAPARVIYTSPQGVPLTQAEGARAGALPRLVIVCGRYEGVDERFLAERIDEEISIGDYVLSGGELAAAVLIDVVGRLQEGALNDADSASQDSFEDGLLDCPHYTRSESGARTGCRRCCCPGTTPRSGAGAGSRAWAAPGCAGRSCWSVSASTRRTGRCSRPSRPSGGPLRGKAKTPSQSAASLAIMTDSQPPA